jgi:hypothetical protein
MIWWVPSRPGGKETISPVARVRSSSFPVPVRSVGSPAITNKISSAPWWKWSGEAIAPLSSS